ncbi:MAG: DNA-processing protein DprA [Sphingomonadaceae bacterium]
MILSHAERLARLRLIRTEGIGPASFRRLLERFGSAEQAAAALPDLAGRTGAIFPQAEAEEEMARAETVAAAHVFLGEADYPPLLAQLPDAPPVLLASGDLALARRPVLGIVGARNASAAGRQLAAAMAEALGAEGWVIVSGMARGIDAAAHQAALATGTIACVAGGTDIFYPPENAALQERVLESGLVLSEMPPGTQPQARHFPRRNRLIAGIAEGLLVIEAAQGSGSLITARLAGEAGREVMAVPGHPADPRARGGNGLIKSGATLVEDPVDVLAALRPFALAGDGVAEPAQAIVEAEDETPQDARAIIEALLSPAPVAVDLLVRESGLPAGAVAAILLELELAGRLVRHSGGRVASA